MSLFCEFVNNITSSSEVRLYGNRLAKLGMSESHDEGETDEPSYRCSRTHSEQLILTLMLLA